MTLSKLMPPSMWATQVRMHRFRVKHFLLYLVVNVIAAMNCMKADHL